MARGVDFRKFVVRLVSSKRKSSMPRHDAFLLAILTVTSSCGRHSTQADAGEGQARFASLAACSLACAKKVRAQCDHDHPTGLSPIVRNHDGVPLERLRKADPAALRRLEAAELHEQCNSQGARDECAKECTSSWPSKLAGCVANTDTFEQMDPCFSAFGKTSD
jgi:hypothetical protein